MTRIRAGRYQNLKTRKMEVIEIILPITVFIYCRWCGERASEKMYLIKSEEDMVPLEEHYSNLCKCRVDFPTPM